MAVRLAAAGCIAPDEEAAELVAAAGDADRLEELVRRRTSGEPLAWLVGGLDFCGLWLQVHQGVYVPRWQTEALARRAAALLPPEGTAVDLCTGAGAVAAVMGVERPAATVVATDVDPTAVACARANGVDALVGDLDGPLPAHLRGRVDVLTAVVPYVPTDALPLLPRDVVAFEPRDALDGGEGGLEVLSTVVARSTRWLRPGGWLLLEIGAGQAAALAGPLDRAGFGSVAVLRDAEGDDRALEGRYGTTTPVRADNCR